MKFISKMIVKTFYFGMIAILCMLAFVVITSKASGGEPTLFGHQLKVVLSGSMEPTFETGSVILIQETTPTSIYKENDIITFQSSNKLITHRIVEVKHVNDNILYKTKGDHNNAADTDYVLHENIVGQYADFTIPKLGYFVQFASTKEGSALLLIVPGFLLVLSSIKSIVSAIREFETSKA